MHIYVYIIYVDTYTSIYTYKCKRPDWGVYRKSGRQVCIASTCLLVNFWKASL